MSRGAKFVYLIYAGWFVVIAAGAWLHFPRNRMFLILPMAVYLGALIISFVWMLRDGERLRDRAAIPLAVGLGTAVIAVIVAPRLFDAGFARIMPRYAGVIQQIEAGQVAVGSDPTAITLRNADAKLGYAAWATRASNGVLMVTFFVGGSFPVKHWGYLYSSAGEILEGSFEDSQWPKRRRLREKWFYIAD